VGGDGDMNQYIITEEQMMEIQHECIHYDCPDGEGCPNNCPYTNYDSGCDFDVETIVTSVRSHPYNPQAEREKVLEELEKFFTIGWFAGSKTVPRDVLLGKLEELREGKDGE
jgi:hypothetical protein